MADSTTSTSNTEPSFRILGAMPCLFVYVQSPRVSVGNLKFAFREGKFSDSQPILNLYKLILLLSAIYYINNE